MSFIEIFIISIGLSMDAFAASICKGFSLGKDGGKNKWWIGIYFGFFQGLMPILGYLLGFKFNKSISAIDHWIAFILLGIIGFNMIRESKVEKNQCLVEESFKKKDMILLSLATSIDALVIGITFAFLGVKIIKASVLIGIVTFLISTLGVVIGSKVGGKLKSKAEFLGGIVLISMGTKILLTHLGII